MNDVIYIIIAFYNEEDMVISCVNSILPALGASDKLVIVDNSSIKTNIKTIFKDYKNVIIINTDAGIGFGKANNIGAQYALQNGASYVLCLNQDTISDGSFIKKLLDPLKESSEIVLSAPVIYNYAENTIESFYIQWYYGEVNNLFSDALSNELKKYYLTQKVSGACFLIKTSFIKQFGFFDENYFMYLEDEDLCRRIISANYKIVLVPLAQISHVHSNTNATGPIKTKKILWQRRSTSIYALKNANNKFIKSLLSITRKNFIDYIILFLGAKFKLLFNYIKVDFLLIFSLKKIYSSYKNEKHKILQKAL